MAKRKHAAALFEVFHDNRGPSARSTTALRTLNTFRAWFAGRAERVSAGAHVEVDPNDPTTLPIKSPLITQSAPVEVVKVAPPPPQPAPAPPPQIARPIVQKTEELREVADSAAASPTPEHPGHFQFHLDRDRREVTMRLAFSTVVVACFGIVLSIALAYVLGRRAAMRPPVLAAESQSVGRTNEIKRGALDIPRKPSHPVALAGANDPMSLKPPTHFGDEVRAHDHDSTGTASGLRETAQVVPEVPDEDKPREIGLNYFLVQTYPNQAAATEARDFLVKNRVSCTVEKAPPGFVVDPSWYAVISMRGFERDQLHSPECENLKKQIEKLGEKFAGNARFKRFSPQLFKLK